MPRLFTNNATSTLASGINNSVTSLAVATGQGALFPNPTSPDYFMATLESGSTREIVKVTARSTDTFTIVRAQESTSAASWSTGATVALRATAGAMAEVGSLVKLSTIVTAASQADATFSSISGDYTHLLLRVQGRATAATNSQPLYGQCNADTGSNYSSILAASSGPATSLYLGALTAASQGANLSSSNEILFFNYTDTAWYKRYQSTVGVRDTTTVGQQGTGHWANTAAITSLRLFPGSGNFVDGTILTLYGSI